MIDISRKLRLGLTLIALSVIELTILNVVPWSLFKGYFSVNPTISFTSVGLFALLLIKLLNLRIQRYFRLPRFTPVSIFAMALAVVLVIPAIFFVENEPKSLGVSFFGVLFLLSIGFGEELFTRGFVFGVLEKFGIKTALFYSSLVFGLMHLNKYTGDEWDPWNAYGHVMSAFSFGLFACALMIVTRSIWVSVVFHALSDWFIVFEKFVDDPETASGIPDAIWKGILAPFVEVGFYGGLACLILWLNRGVGFSDRGRRLLMRFKLVRDTQTRAT